jgi:hypothetical protein
MDDFGRGAAGGLRDETPGWRSGIEREAKAGRLEILLGTCCELGARWGEIGCRILED